jgi:3-deoxy-D-manno-octulosonate 8-phosphate phosphatase (KDO 8-P phosphatase)
VTARAAATTRILFLDVDGTLTDGGIILGVHEDIRRFHAHDGVGIRLATLAGIEVIFLSARECVAAERRARELGVKSVLGAARKDEHVRTLCAEAGVTPAEAAFVGDDLQDLPALRIVGRSIAVGDAVADVRDACHHVTRAFGGRGAVREAVEWILKEEGRWESTLAAFLERSDFVIRLDASDGENRT